MAFGRGNSYTTHRIPLYVLLWLTSVALLGLTAFRIHFTRKNAHFTDRIVAEILTASALTILWVPYALMTLLRQRSHTRGANTNANTGANGHLPNNRNELVGNTVLWILFLIGGAIATNKWANTLSRGVGMQSRILAAIVALTWVAFGLLTLIKILALMQRAAATALGSSAAGYGTAGHHNDKHLAGGAGTNAPVGAAGQTGAGYA